MPFTPETITSKPNNQCIRCDNLGVICDGPNAASMSNERFCEWCKLRKNELGWSNQKLADVTGLSKTTIDRIMTGKITGLNGETINILSCALVYGYNSSGNSWGKFPCPLSANAPDDDAKALREENARLLLQLKQQADNDRSKIDHLKRQIDFDEDQLRKKDKLLDDRSSFMRRKDRIITILSILLGITVFLIPAALMIDAMNPNVGFFWRTALSAFR